MLLQYHQKKFEEVTKFLAETPSIVLLDPNLEARLETYASCKKYLGYVLRQRQDSEWISINVYNRILSIVSIEINF